MVVVFDLVTYGDDGNGRLVLDFEQCDVARSSEWHDQFSEEGTGARLAAREGRRLQHGNAGARCGHGQLWQIQVTAISGQLSFDEEVEQLG